MCKYLQMSCSLNNCLWQVLVNREKLLHRTFRLFGNLTRTENMLRNIFMFKKLWDYISIRYWPLDNNWSLTKATIEFRGKPYKAEVWLMVETDFNVIHYTNYTAYSVLVLQQSTDRLFAQNNDNFTTSQNLPHNGEFGGSTSNKIGLMAYSHCTGLEPEPGRGGSGNGTA